MSQLTKLETIILLASPVDVEAGAAFTGLGCVWETAAIAFTAAARGGRFLIPPAGPETPRFPRPLLRPAKISSKLLSRLVDMLYLLTG